LAYEKSSQTIRGNKMNDLVDAVKQIRLLPETIVDVGFRQGRDAVLNQFNEETGQDGSSFIDKFIDGMKSDITELIESAKPYEIPEEYIFFLEQYGGLAIINDDFYLATLGIGPLVEIYYSSTRSDEAFHEVRKYGFLSIGGLRLSGGKYKHKGIEFFLDLGGTVQKDSIIGVGPQRSFYFNVIKDVHSHPTSWKITANSFIEWLRLVAETEGLFDYI
jgi:hypothetical protein